MLKGLTFVSIDSQKVRRKIQNRKIITMENNLKNNMCICITVSPCCAPETLKATYFNKIYILRKGIYLLFPYNFIVNNKSVYVRLAFLNINIEIILQWFMITFP